MKRRLNLWLLAALLCGMSMSVTSCKDDDKNDNMSEEQQQEQQAIAEQEREMTALNVLDYLADLSDAPADYFSGSYEPSIGVADGGDAGTRIVNTNDMETAAMRFSDMVEADIDEDTQTYTWSDERVGTLTYTKSSDGKSWATVDVSIKQVPHLQKIIYRSPEQSDNNQQFDGTAFYRFGDIVKKKNADGKYEYWICVRPCFGPEGKENSHWVTLSPLPSKNVYNYHSKTNGIDYALPTGLNNNHEHSQNLAEMLFAICFPNEWHQNIINNPKTSKSKGVPMFNDFDKADLRYHSNHFWQRVQDVWKKRDYFKMLFGVDFSEFQKGLKSKDGLNLLTNGYSWWVKSSNKPTLYRYRFVNGDKEQSNMHMEPIKSDMLKNYHSVKNEVIDAKISLNCVTDYTAENPGWSVPAFFGTANKHYIIRHATGSELATNKEENVKDQLEGVETVYNYNSCYGFNVNDDLETFDENGKSSKEPNVAYNQRAYYLVGDIVVDENGRRWVCMQSSSHGYSDDNPYSYFVSFDAKSVGDKFEYLPTSKELTAQMLFDIELLTHNFQITRKSVSSTAYNQEKNIAERLGVKLSELVGMRDTMYAYTADIRHGNTQLNPIPCDFVSALYRDGNEIRVLRLVADYTAEQDNGVRDWSWHFYTNYTGSEVPMKLEDLGNQDMINRYNKDKWVVVPWTTLYEPSVRIKANYGPRTTTEDVDQKNWSRFFYQAGRTAEAGTVPANMYREPIIVFSVQRVYDNGRKATCFDGTDIKFTEYAMVRELKPSLFADDGDTYINHNTYDVYSPIRIYLEEKIWPFGMSNKTPNMLK